MPESRSFRIRVVFGASFAFAEGMNFDIHDVTNDLICVYNYVGISESLGLPASASTRGPWNAFSTTRPMRVDGFGGIASTAGGGAGDAGFTALSINPLFAPPVFIAPFQTGFTVGGTLIGAGAGLFEKMFPPIAAAQAPFPHNV